MDEPPATSAINEGWFVTLSFWGTLLVAAFLFATVALAPKLQTLAAMDAEYAENQFRLVELERQANELGKVAEALENDPSFATELAKLEFAAVRAGDERIAVPDELQLGVADLPLRGADYDIGRRVPLPPLLLTPLATNAVVRSSLLVLAALLAMTAFAVITAEHAATVKRIASRTAAATRAAADRYRKAA